MNLTKIKDYLNNKLIDRKEVIDLALIALFSGESIFLLGPPGTGKSYLAREIKNVCLQATSFEYLMNKFSTPDEIFGQIDVSKIKEGKFVRKTTGFLPTANIVFLDEIWKSSSAIQNTLLTIINEKLFRNDGIEQKVDLVFLIAASNELPEKNQGLEALWDRFSIRYLINPIQEKNHFKQMVLFNNSDKQIVLTDHDKIDLKQIPKYQDTINQVSVSDLIFDYIWFLKNKINEYNQTPNHQSIYVSDRKWRKIINLLKTSAFLNHRKQVYLVDCFIIKFLLWNEEYQIQDCENLIIDSLNEYVKTLVDFQDFETQKKFLFQDFVNQFLKIEYQPTLYSFQNVNLKKIFWKQKHQTIELFEDAQQNLLISENGIWTNCIIHDYHGLIVRDENANRNIKIFLKNGSVFNSYQEFLKESDLSKDGFFYDNDQMLNKWCFLKIISKTNKKDFLIKIDQFTQFAWEYINKLSIVQEQFKVKNDFVSQKQITKSIGLIKTEMTRLEQIFNTEIIPFKNWFQKITTNIIQQINEDSEVYWILEPYFYKPFQPSFNQLKHDNKTIENQTTYQNPASYSNQLQNQLEQAKNNIISHDQPTILQKTSKKQKAL